MIYILTIKQRRYTMMTFGQYVAKQGNFPKVGQKVYIMTYNWGHYSGTLVTIKSVSPTGRKIVTVRENGHEDIFNNGDHQNKYSKAFLEFDVEGRQKQIEGDKLRKEAIALVDGVACNAERVREGWSRESLIDHLQAIRDRLEQAEAAVALLPYDEA